MPCKIVIPSHKRHDRVFAKKLVNDPIICVAESQADLYQQFNPECEIVTHPDDVMAPLQRLLRLLNPCSQRSLRQQSGDSFA